MPQLQRGIKEISESVFDLRI